MTTERNRPEPLEGSEFDVVGAGPSAGPYLKARHLPPPVLYSYETASKSVATAQAEAPETVPVRNMKG